MDINEALYTNLRQMGVLDEKILEDCKQEAEKSGLGIAQILEQRDLVSDDNLGRLTADFYSIPYVKLSETELKTEWVRLIAEPYARAHACIVVERDQDNFTVAISKPEDTELKLDLGVLLGPNVKFVYATDKEIQRAMRAYVADPQAMFEKVMNSNLEAARNSASEPPIVKMVETILTYGYEQGASDIHIEPTVKHTFVRYRIDGMLVDAITIPPELHEKIVMRIKVMAHLRTDEQHSAQDGKLSFETPAEIVDVRVSIVPIVEGENIVLRLLSAQSRQHSLTELGFGNQAANKLEAAKNKPHGMILATGPTGSGKTTTLYSILKRLNVRDVHIMTIEDPVEYMIAGVNQIQVNEQTNLTFAEGLRAIVRQDPNIILVGEIRDEETADIAVNAAMTGHLVLSSLHTNDAATTIPRLLDMGVEPFLVASTVNVIVAQRLVRKLCNKCRVSQEVEIQELQKKWGEEFVKLHFGENSTRIYVAKGCPVCANSGYKGRVGIFEVLEMTDAVREAIMAKKDASEIMKVAVAGGMQTMLQDGIEKIKSGVTSLEEVMRVTNE